MSPLYHGGRELDPVVGKTVFDYADTRAKALSGLRRVVGPRERTRPDPMDWELGALNSDGVLSVRFDTSQSLESRSRPVGRARQQRRGAVPGKEVT